MSWLAPLSAECPKKPEKRPALVGGGRTKRPVVVEGKRYGSMRLAIQATGLSQRQIYKLMGEGKRYK